MRNARGGGWNLSIGVEQTGQPYHERDDGPFLVVPNPWNPGRVMYVIAANSGMQFYDMTETYHREIPQWARFKGNEIVDRCYCDRPGFVIDLGE